MKGGRCSPPSARVEYAEAMSSTETSLVPRVSAGTASSSEVMPMRWARAATFSGPTSSMIWA